MIARCTGAGNTDEAALLRFLLTHPAGLRRLRHVLDRAAFRCHRHRQIYEALLELDAWRAPTDVVAVAARLRDRGQLRDCGGLSYLADLAELGDAQSAPTAMPRIGAQMDRPALAPARLDFASALLGFLGWVIRRRDSARHGDGGRLG